MLGKASMAIDGTNSRQGPCKAREAQFGVDGYPAAVLFLSCTDGHPRRPSVVI